MVTRRCGGGAGEDRAVTSAPSGILLRRRRLEHKGTIMNKKKNGRLPIRAETIRALATDQLSLVAGGAPSRLSGCCSGNDPICYVSVVFC